MKTQAGWQMKYLCICKYDMKNPPNALRWCYKTGSINQVLLSRQGQTQLAQENGRLSSRDCSKIRLPGHLDTADNALFPYLLVPYLLLAQCWWTGACPCHPSWVPHSSLRAPWWRPRHEVFLFRGHGAGIEDMLTYTEVIPWSAVAMGWTLLQDSLSQASWALHRPEEESPTATRVPSSGCSSIQDRGSGPNIGEVLLWKVRVGI